jgi:hypothetical protein
MKRYYHLMYKVHGRAWPGSVAVVAVRGAAREGSSPEGVRSERLVSWHICCLRKRGEAYERVATISGRARARFWQELYRYARHGGTTWVYSYGCPRVWALLGLWEEIESERFYFYGRDGAALPLDELSGVRSRASLPDDGAAARAVPGLRRQHQGYLVLEDPPCVARLKPAGQPGWVQWVDTRNYGCTFNEGPDRPAARAGLVADWFCAFHRAAQDYNLGSLQATAGSQALHAFRHGYLNGSVYVHCTKPVLDLEDRSFYGGRAECFRIGYQARPSWHLDYRSQYAAVCATTLLPARLIAHGPLGSLVDLWRALCSGGVIADVTLLTDEAAYPFRRERRSDVLFPTGRFRTVLAGPELTDAWQRGRVVEAHYAAVYQLTPCLVHYARSLYRLRCEAEKQENRGLAMLAKRLLVSLPGKLGQRNRFWEPAPDVWTTEPYCEWPYRDEAGQWLRMRSIAWVVHRERSTGFAADAVPAIAAWITSEGRRRLLESVRTAGRAHVLYVDTDSLMVDEAGYYSLAPAEFSATAHLGQLYRKSGPVSIEIRGVKHYVENGQLTCAGLPAGTYCDAGDGRHYWYAESPAKAVKEKHRPSADAVLKPYLRAGPYQHGVVGADGVVTPFHLEE